MLLNRADQTVKFWYNQCFWNLSALHIPRTHTHTRQQGLRKGQLAQPAVCFGVCGREREVEWEVTMLSRRRGQTGEAKARTLWSWAPLWWRAFSLEKRAFWPFIEGQRKRLHNLRGNHYSIQLPLPRLLLPPEGKGGDWWERRGDEKAEAQDDKAAVKLRPWSNG